MELLHHQAMLRQDDGQFICSRCGVMNPADDEPCLPETLEPSQEDSQAA